MADTTAIEWTDATWNPVTGCTRISLSCDTHDRLDRVAPEGQRPTWRRIWPTTPANPDYDAYLARTHAYGHNLRVAFNLSK
ncbi:DUF5131 family protein [Streptomyces sp. MA15]|uniref:DUF5131 family protein n=1 Tax=Streptomyces sp. MA15 TaxID=3055061 RepID=UPI0025B1E0DF|nr:DUF5131 family protein [Streptomyces sp. MA15]MDN3267057.1 DUF5131 family protein [Streptomyces sp. MA15]